MSSLNDPVTKLHLVGPASEKALHHLEINSIHDLLYHFPRDWQDLSEIKTIAEVKPNEKINLRAKVAKISDHHTRWRRMHITEALLEDQTGSVVAVWFNQPFLKKYLYEGSEYYFSGKGQLYAKDKNKTLKLQLANPTFEQVKKDTIHTAGIVPVYELTEGITEKQMRYWQKQAQPIARDIKEFLPPALLTRQKLPGLAQALHDIHFPESHHILEQARNRLAFDELFIFQLAFQGYKAKLKAMPAPKIPFAKEIIAAFIKRLPFSLTASQRLAIFDILSDISKPHPMNRLLEGEVGSGKTVVAGLAMYVTAYAKFQSILLAPTEILAWQHFQTLKELFKNTDLEIALLTRSHKTSVIARSDMTNQSRENQVASPPARNDNLLNNIIAGTTKIIIGTHALLQESVQFHKIGLLIVDEQHRFGVKQRAKLIGSGEENPDFIPHLLTMTATPIPRTLALALYGDLEISELSELPKGRKPIITKLVRPDGRDIAYKFIRQEVKKGYQVYVVTPLIEESDKLGVKAATLEYEKLQKEIFPEFTIGLLHGRLKGQDKKQIMERFKQGKIQILVATTVVEVGVDIPNATIMVIENAERFGLSQLHQLRGRVGRSDLQSYCLLFAGNMSDYTRARLEAVVKSTNGFELAEKDLELRGPGEVIGTRQSGFIPFKIAKLSDQKLIRLAKDEAQKLLEVDEKLAKYPQLAEKTATLMKEAHLE